MKAGTDTMGGSPQSSWRQLVDMDEQQSTLARALVGRQRELSDAHAALDAALAGAGALLLVTGEAGIGKTRFVEALTSRAGVRTVWGACWDDPGTPAFWPWTMVLRECATAFGLVPGDDLAPILGSSAHAGGPAQQIRLRLFDGAASYLSEAGRVERLTVVLEDLHVADEASLDLLRFLGTALRGQPVAIIGTYRYPDLAPGVPLADALTELARTARTTALYGLDEDEVGELMTTTTGTRANARLAARVRERTGGNPLFVTEVTKLLVAKASLEADHLPIPPSVHQVIAHRLSYLRGATLDVLAHASVVGQVFSEEVVAHAAREPLGGVADALDEAIAAGLVQRMAVLGNFGFTHALVRDVVYAGMPAAVRRVRHRLVAEAIRALHGHDLDDHVDKLADHYVLALPDADPAEALTYSDRAGRRAMRMLAYEQSARHFARAVELAERASADEAHRVQLLLDLGDARLRSGDWDAASATYEEVAASARRRHRSDELARAALGLGAGLSGFEIRLFDQRQLDLLREAFDALSEGEIELRAWLLARMSVAESYVVPEDVRVTHSRQALAWARQAGDPKLLAYALSSYCDAIPGPAHTEERLELADEMVRLGVAARDAESELLGRRFRLVALLEAGDIIGVDDEIEAFALVAARLRWPLVEWYPRLWRGMRALMEGRLVDAERLASRVQEIGRRAGSVNAGITADVQRLVWLLEQGRPADAYEQLGWFLDDPQGGPNAEAWLVLPLTRAGRHAEARAVLDRLAAAGFPLHVDGAWLEVVAGLAEGCAEVAHPDAARGLIDVIRPFGDRFATGATGAVCLGSMRRHLGLLEHCAGRWDEADAEFRLAATANRRAGAALLVAHTLRQHAALLRDRGGPGDEVEADTLLTEANETYRQLGLDHWIGRSAAARPAARVQDHVFRRDGETWVLRYGGRETRVGHVKGHTTLARLLAEPGREFHVLDLVADGIREEVTAAAAGDTGEVIDAQARRAYRRRLTELEADLDDAARTGDIALVERARQERDALVQQLAAAYGLGGRSRRGNDPVERARWMVTKQIRTAIDRIRREHAALALHLTNSVRTGRYCSYAPEQPVRWQL